MTPRFRLSRSLAVSAVAGAALFAGAASAQTTSAGTQQPSTQQERVSAVLGALFGDRLGSTTSLESQWSLGRTPLLSQRTQFDARIDTDVRSGALSASSGARLKSDYASVVDLETRYGADRRFTTQERADLADRYGAVTQALADGGYRDGGSGAGVSTGASVSTGKAEFDARVDAAVAQRRLSRTDATRLKTDYSALITVEAGYLRDGAISANERDDLDARLDALDARVGDVAYGGAAPVVQTPAARLDAIARALPSSGLSATAQTQLKVEHEDLTRLAAAYARVTVSTDERAYLERRLTDLETRARVRR